MPAGLSSEDHQLRGRRHGGYWRLDPRWLWDRRVEEAMKCKLALYWELNETSASLPMLWDSFKATIRGEYISVIKTAKTVQREE